MSTAWRALPWASTAAAISGASGAYVYVGAAHTGSGWLGLPNLTDVYFTGTIDELSIYGHALTPEDVATHYAAYKSASSSVAPMVSVQVTDPGGQHETDTYDPANGYRQVSTTDAYGAKTTYGYDTSGFLNTVTDPDGDLTITGHDVRGNTVSQTTCQDQANNKCSTVYYTYYPDDTSTTLSPDPRNDLMLTMRDGRSVSATDNSCARPAPGEQPGCTPTLETAILAGGCFWGMQEIIRQIPGVVSTDVGYTGGRAGVTYEDMHHDTTGNAEAVRIVFDPARLSYADLLENWFFRMHDPTTPNRQGNDMGPQYRSVIFVTSLEQRETAERVKKRVNESGKWPRPLVTQITDAGPYTLAEDYHQDYLQKHPGGYTCHYLRDFPKLPKAAE